MSDSAMGTAPRPEERSVSELVTDVTTQATTLLRKEVELAMSELKDEMKRAAKAGGMLSGAAVSGYFALLFASLAAAWVLDRRLPRHWAFALVAMAHGAMAASLLKLGHEEVKQLDPVPTETIETLKDTVEVARSAVG